MGFITPSVPFAERWIIKKELNEEQWKLFEACSCKMSGYTSSESCQMFQHGFRLAVKLIVAGLGAQGES